MAASPYLMSSNASSNRAIFFCFPLFFNFLVFSIKMGIKKPQSLYFQGFADTQCTSGMVEITGIEPLTS